MQGLANFAELCATILNTLLPTFLYASAIFFFLFAGWGFWQQAQPHNPFRSKPWIPVLSLILSGFAASFPALLTAVDVSAGSSVSVDSVVGLGSYVPTGTAPLLGATPAETVVNIVTVFQDFFQAYGAMACFFAMFAWWSVMTGRSNRSQGGCGIQFVFGICLINIMTITQCLVSIFSTTA